MKKKYITLILKKMLLQLICIGIISGILTGITGIQAGILVPTLLIFNLIPDIKTAIGTTLYVFLPPTAIFSVYYLYKQKHVDLYKGNILMAVIALSALLGSYISVRLSNKIIQLIEACMFLCLSIFYFHLYLK